MFEKLDKTLGLIDVEFKIRYNDQIVIKNGRLGWEAFFEFYWGNIKQSKNVKEAAMERLALASKVKVGNREAILEDVISVFESWDKVKNASVDAESSRKASDEGPYKVGYRTGKSGIAVVTRIRK